MTEMSFVLGLASVCLNWIWFECCVAQ